MKANYYNICLRVTIAEILEFYTVESISILNSIDVISDTATVIIPRRFIQTLENPKNGEKKNLIEFIKIGDKIKIEAGYDNELNTEFEGYITEITDETPIILKCMDEMYKLKKMEKINKLFPHAELKKVLEFIAPNYKIETPKEYSFGKFAIENATPYEVLQQLRTNYMIRSYFKDGILHAGFPINLTGFKSHDFNWARNVRNSDGLKFERKENTYYLKMTTTERGTQKKISVEIGKKGDINKEVSYNVGLTKKELETIANDIYNGIKNTKCTGDFKTWGLPQTRAGDSANINDPNFPKGYHNGKFLIQSVKIDLNSSDGFKRTNTLGVSLE